MASFGTSTIALIAVLSWGSLVPWHTTTLFCAAALTGLAWPADVLCRRLGIQQPPPAVVFGGLLLAEMLLLISTGGIHSPLILPLIPQAMMVGFVVPDSMRYPIGGLLGIVVLLLGAEQIEPIRLALHEPALANGHRGLGTAIYGALLCFVLIAGNRAGRRARDIVTQAHLQIQQLQRAQIDDLDRAQQAQFSLTSTLAHELKNPLTTLLALATYLQRLAEPDGHQEELDAMVEELRRMRSSVDDLLDISKPGGVPSASSVDLHALCTEVATSHRALGLEHGVRLTVEGPQATIWADELRIRQVLQNLVQNAIQAGGNNTEVKVQIAVETDDVRVTVLDRGVGLPQAHPNRVFQLGMTTKPAGSGIGLPVSRAIARHHGGDLTLEDRQGGGCRAEFRLPKQPPEAFVS